MLHSSDGVNNIELVPEITGHEVASRLRRSLKESASLRAAVAYWCVGIAELGQDIVGRLRGDGFLCVDIHLPTDIDKLEEMVSGGANVFLYLFHPNPQPGDLKLQVPPHLLHPKMLLFDFDSAPSELWVGSHNWTARALTGVNIEASLRLLLEQGSAVYISAAKFLDDVRLRCVPFDLTAVDYYKWLQGLAFEEPIWVLGLRGSRSMLDSRQKLTVFGKTEEDYRNLKSVDKNIVVSLLDESAGQEFLFEATVSDTGHLSGAGVDFDSRLYAAHDGSLRPQLRGPEVPPPSVRSASRSWATIGLIEELIGATFELPPTERWVVGEEDAAGLRLSAELRTWFPRPDRPLVMKPVPRDVFEGRHPAEHDAALMLRAGPTLIRRKLVRAKRLSGQHFSLTKRRPKDEERG
jgi:hypothetical protein